MDYRSNAPMSTQTMPPQLPSFLRENRASRWSVDGRLALSPAFEAGDSWAGRALRESNRGETAFEAQPVYHDNGSSNVRICLAVPHRNWTNVDKER